MDDHFLSQHRLFTLSFKVHGVATDDRESPGIVSAQPVKATHNYFDFDPQTLQSSWSSHIQSMLRLDLFVTMYCNYSAKNVKSILQMFASYTQFAVSNCCIGRPVC